MALRVADARAAYGSAEIIRNIDLVVEDGEAVGILGRNGVGKSTLMRFIMGLVPHASGTVSLDGRPLPADPALRARAGLGYVPQGRDVFPRLTVVENIRVAAVGCGRKPGPVTEELLEMFPVLAQRPTIMAGSLSGGQQQILAIARAMATGATLLLLDEPTEGVQPSIVDDIQDMLARLNRERKLAMLVAEQNLDFATGLAERIYIMDKGTVARVLTRDELHADRRLMHELLAV